jgi:4'-phosphopantetheinyl transferase
VDTVRWALSPPNRTNPRTDLDVWLVRRDADDSAGSFLATLSRDERDVVARRRVGSRQYAIARASLRAILGGYLGIPGAELRFRTEPGGRPLLDHQTQVTFSVSHAGAIGLVAVARNRDVGVDIEPLSAAGQIEEIADRYLPVDRVASIRSSAPDVRVEGWVALWTAVEASAKVDGGGLGDLAPSTSARLLERDLRFVSFRPSPDHVGTLAYTGIPGQVNYLEFDPQSDPAVARRV